MSQLQIILKYTLMNNCLSRASKVKIALILIFRVQQVTVDLQEQEGYQGDRVNEEAPAPEVNKENLDRL